MEEQVVEVRTEAGEHQDKVDNLIKLKALLDVVEAAFKAAKEEYTEGELKRTEFPRGDSSQFGEVQGTMKKATKDVIEHHFVVHDPDALKADTSEDFAEWLPNWILDHLPLAAEDYFDEVGELLDGCRIETVTTPGQPKQFGYMKVIPSKETKAAVADMLAPKYAGLIGGAK